MSDSVKVFDAVQYLRDLAAQCEDYKCAQAADEIVKLRRHVDFLERALVASEKQVAKLSEEL